MSLTISACAGPVPHERRIDAPSIVFEDDGYYWFLWPLFARLAAASGQTIDLYGDASFGPEELPLLSSLLAEAIQLVEAQPQNWQVRVGASVGGDVRTVTSACSSTGSRGSNKSSTTRD